MKDALDNQQLKDWATHLYTREDMNLEKIAHETGVDQSQLRQWQTECNWDAVRRTLPTAKDYQLEQLYKLLQKTTEKLNAVDDVNPKDVDLIVKYTAAIKNLDTEISLPQIIEVAKIFTLWLKPKDHSLAKTVTLHFDKFIRERVKPSMST